MGRVLASTGVFLTAAYALFTWWLIGGRIQTLQSMPLNEVGDFLAGAFGPIAIFWLILGFFQQGIELRQGTEALQLQAKELSNSVVQQSELVAAQKESLKNYERSLEPLLNLDDVEVGWSEQGQNVDFCVTNFGGFCDSIIVRLLPQIGVSMHQSLEPLVNGGRRFVRFGSLHEFVDFEVVVEYRTGSGASNSQKFRVDHFEESGAHAYQVKKYDLLY